MATVADELLNDFEDSGSEVDNENENGYQDEEKLDDQKDGLYDKTNGMGLDGSEQQAEEEEDGMDLSRPGAEAEDEAETKARVEKMRLAEVGDVRSVASLMKTLDPILEKIEYYKSLPPEKQTRNVGSIEDNPEYKLLTQSNSISTSIDSEIMLVHKFIRDHYSTRFPELETLVSNPLDYAKTVAIIGNGPMDKIRDIANSNDNIIGLPLNKVINSANILTVTMEASHTRGQPLSDAELATVMRACEMIVRLDKSKGILTEYVQSRMNLFAPNLTALVGSKTAAQLINFAGGINGLAKTPACNLAPLGSKKQNTSGFATNVGLRHHGFLYFSPIIAGTGIPSDLTKQALRIVSAKTILAARVDSVHSAPDGAHGRLLYDQCMERLDKLQEPPPNRGARALPAPDDKPARKRGGRRARKAKEATAMTELRKAQNRMAFGKEEAETVYGNGDSTKGLGMIGASNTGQIRATQIDQRTRAKLSKKNPGWGGATPAGGMQSTFKGFGGGGAGTASVLRNSGLRTSGVGAGANAGTSSVAFTPVQGIELVDPKVRAEMNRKRKAEEDRWFKGGTFTQVGEGASTQPRMDGAFKMPALPAKKKVDTGVKK